MKTTREEGARRLLALANFLDGLPAAKFRFGHWVGSNWEGKPDLSCGTTACAMGWAPSVPELAAAGLRIQKVGETDAWIHIEGDVLDEAHFDDSDAAIDTAERFFGVSNREASFLFMPNHSGNHLSVAATPKEVAAHIRRFVEHDGRELVLPLPSEGDPK